MLKKSDWLIPVIKSINEYIIVILLYISNIKYIVIITLPNMLLYLLNNSIDDLINYNI